MVDHRQLRAGIQQQRGRTQVAPVQRAVQARPGANDLWFMSYTLIV